jgi:hypothetical protein
MTLGSKEKKWQKQEKEIAGKMKGKRTKQSGGGYQKGDVKSDKFIIECKCTKFKSFSITERLLDKLEKDSFGSEKVPVICIDLEDGKRRFWVLTDDAFEKVCP